MDMAGVNHGGNNHHGSRLNSLEQPVLNGNPQEHKDSLQDEEVDEVDDVDGEGVYGALLGPAQKRRQRSIRNKKDLQDVVSDSRVGSLESLTHTGDRIHSQPLHPRLHSRSPSLRRHSPLHRSPSPSRRPRYDHHQPQYHDVGFSDTVNNVVEIQRHIHHPHSQYNHRHKRGPWSASTSPARSPSPVHRMDHGRHYGTTSLEQRSRSPSPASRRQPIHPHHHHHPHQHSYPVLVTRRGQGRRLPPTPNKPSTLQLKPSNINFPKLNASPTHGPHLMGHHPAQVPVHHMGNIPPAGPPQCPLSFEQAVAMGRGGRLLPSPVPNGFKPPSAGLSSSKQRIPRSRHSDSDEDDWC